MPFLEATPPPKRPAPTIGQGPTLLEDTAFYNATALGFRVVFQRTALLSLQAQHDNPANQWVIQNNLAEL